jgi:MoaA/NifB/PqqE/SkfB family radical SAM enzyme
MRVFLDDIRDPPKHDRLTGEKLVWDRVIRNGGEAIELVEKGLVTFMSFDHDIGFDYTGYDVAKRIEELAYAGKIPPIDYAVHSANPVGADRIDQAMKSAWRFWDARK